MKINNFRGELTDMSSKKEALLVCRRYVALCSALKCARARLCLVKQLLGAKECGRACVQAQYALSELRHCKVVAEGDAAWLSVRSLPVILFINF